MDSIRRDMFLCAFVVEAGGVRELIRSSPKFPLSADSSSAWLYERLTASAANGYRQSNRIIGLARIHLLLFPLTLMIGVEGESEGGSNQHKTGLMWSFFRTSLEQCSNPYPKQQNKIDLHRAHFCYPNQHIFLAFPLPF